ncbi:hypothetical protein AWJ20_1816 [Sugiyamaella lignohabitans]|uniref:Zn(2)-C6 fungal-type domain-containing protein n=1 Tax=Sugiyamaella lignohabitans TaxID=796027 RepID=A0A167E0Y5_9ASCO|nr:uncharacterized protein AWJ20_1816 [Sugiyamaella lignohabitans]ANB13521.1 hypothetical protein AWJ20_1816 [Sugiyamaella lignohabitans]
MSDPTIRKEKKPRGIRKPLSCTECRRRKLKCDRNLPCSTCVRRGRTAKCGYNNEPGDRREQSNSRPGHITTINGSHPIIQVGENSNVQPIPKSRLNELETHVLQLESLLQEVQSFDESGLSNSMPAPRPLPHHQHSTDSTSSHSTGETNPSDTFSPPVNGPVSVSSTSSIGSVPSTSSFERRPSEVSQTSDPSPTTTGSLDNATGVNGSNSNPVKHNSNINSLLHPSPSNMTPASVSSSSSVSSKTAEDTLTAMAGIHIQRGHGHTKRKEGSNGGEIISSSTSFTIPSVQLTALVDQVNLLKNALILNGAGSSNSTPQADTVKSEANNPNHSGPSFPPVSGPATSPWFHPEAHGFPFMQQGVSHNQSLTIESLLPRIPPIPICDYLVQEYLMVCSNVFHVMYSPYIEERYQTFRNYLETRNDPTPSLPILALMFAIFDSAVAYLGDDDRRLMELSKKYDFFADQPLYAMSGLFRSAALECLVADNFLLKHNILTVQTLLVILDTSLHKDADDGPCFPIFGLIISMALTLGCNTDLEEGSPYAKGGLSVIEREERHRCWAGILLIDNLLTCLFGRPSMAVSLSSPGCLPMNTNDFYLKMGNYEPVINNSEITHMTFILSKVKISSVFADVYARMRHKRPFTYEEVLGIDQVCRAKKEQWDMPYKSNRGYTQLSEVKYDILHNLLDQNLLLLHRPFFNIHEESRLKCIKSATNIVHRLKRFCDDPLYLPFNIYTRGLGLFYCFHTSVVLALAVAQEIVAHRDPFKIFEDFDLGLSIIRRQIPYSKVAERSCTVLTRFR